jgi:hypothetical protein
VGSAVVVQSQKGHLSKTGWSPLSAVNHEWNLRHFRTETVVADGGDVAVYAVTGSPSDASASGSNHQNLGVR